MVDAALVALAYFLAFWLRFSFVPIRYHRLLIATWPWVIIGTVVILALSRVYQRRWRYVSQRDIEHILRALFIATVLLVTIVAIDHPIHRPPTPRFANAAVLLPDGVIVLFPLLAVALLVGARLVVRAVYDRRLPGLRATIEGNTVLIVGAGEGGRLVVRELVRNSDLRLIPVGFVDDDPLKQRLRFDGVRVRGTTRDLPQLLDDAEPDEVIIAIPSAPGELRMRIVTACRDRGIPVRTLPTVFELLSGSVDVART
ncbi:MAG TPA: polysaccharide biosynthesis protein, partial [Solirubrobacteraceae bacterium]|nr:polysaccharide biosynthesis protein [Solirubrobacteraceae bacterium]